MGGGKESRIGLADFVPNRRDRGRVIQGLRNYLSNPLGLQTNTTFGNESSQMAKKEQPKSEKPKSAILIDAGNMTISQLLASAVKR